MKNVCLLGSTGSIGVSALEVIGRYPARFRVVALGAGRNVRLLSEQIARHKPEVVSVLDDDSALELKEIAGSSQGTTILTGREGYREIASIAGVDDVISAQVGAAGLLPTIAAIEAGKNIALANKETMVMAGQLVMELARTKGVRIIPVDSEHSAIFQCLAGYLPSAVRKIILTASGGPFFRMTYEQMEKVTVAEALRHPNWSMGRKITIDSATMMNKGLEVIEARWLFDVEFDRIEVIIHPQSVIHSLVEYEDNALMAQLGPPDMKIPIAYALSYPERIEATERKLLLTQTEPLEFFPPDGDSFPLLGLAYDAGRKGGTAPAVLNAANEIAVQAFLAEKISFTEISQVVAAVLDIHEARPAEKINDILTADGWARAAARKLIERIDHC
ncbi:MAG: 1-deoxy-D-xylulose-5-phosphate reductoisomerase [Smithellaceae bacterium]|nr:1-deoxy-D-xylulose-5-phosphate reductoisomerase [Smithellaceae bacterium]